MMSVSCFVCCSTCLTPACWLPGNDDVRPGMTVCKFVGKLRLIRVKETVQGRRKTLVRLYGRERGARNRSDSLIPGVSLCLHSSGRERT